MDKICNFGGSFGGMEYVRTIAREDKVRSILKWVYDTSRVTYYHSIKTALLTERMIEYLPYYNEEEKKEILRGALLHDVGKAELSKAILEYPGRLSGSALEYVRKHALIGYFKINDQFDVIPSSIALLHHEKLDGSGYPAGERNIPEYVQVVTVADMYEALTSERCYKRAYTHEEAMRLLWKDVRKGKLNGEYVNLVDKVV